MDLSGLFQSNDPWKEGRLKLLASKLDYRTPYALLLGSNESGKTSLAFHWAISQAQKDQHVLFICPSKDKLHIRPPLFYSEEPETAASVLKRIEIKYIDSTEVLQTFLASIHTLGLLPGAIVVDDFSAFCTPPENADQTAHVAKTCAFIIEAATYITAQRKTKSEKPCTVLLTDNIANALIESAPGPRLLDLYTRWFPLVLRIQEEQEHFKLFIQKTPEGADPHGLSVTFKVEKHDVLQLLSVNFTLPTTTTQSKNNEGIVVDLHVVNKYYETLASGAKTVEGRLEEGELGKVQTGDYLLMNGTLLLRITRVVRYPTFLE
eukprot:Ihof_evm11s10 gene=Ihof_evmTU11s10